jgi:hypothetical protein
MLKKKADSAAESCDSFGGSDSPTVTTEPNFDSETPLIDHDAIAGDRRFNQCCAAFTVVNFKITIEKDLNLLSAMI